MWQLFMNRSICFDLTSALLIEHKAVTVLISTVVALPLWVAGYVNEFVSTCTYPRKKHVDFQTTWIGNKESQCRGVICMKNVFSILHSCEQKFINTPSTHSIVVLYIPKQGETLKVVKTLPVHLWHCRTYRIKFSIINIQDKITFSTESGLQNLSFNPLETIWPFSGCKIDKHAYNSMMISVLSVRFRFSSISHV